jgi:hypothetical protein
MFKERTITGTGVSNDVSIFAESINDGGEIHFMTGGSATKRVTIDSSGNVGIGTTPSSFFAGSNQLVVGDGSGEQGITLYAGASSTSYLLFADGTSGAAQYAAQINYHHGTNKLGFCTNEDTTARMVIDSTGKVGIGTTAPYGRLELKGNGNSWTTAPAIRMWDDLNNKGWLVGSANNLTAGDFYIRTLPSIGGTPGATEREFTIKHATGFVGIGTYSPGAKLEISGKDDAGASDLLRLQFDNSPGDTGITFTDINSTIKNRITMDSTNTSDLRISSGTKIHLYGGTTNGTSSPHLTVSNDGSVIVPGTLHSPGHVIQTVYATNTTLVVPSQTVNDYTTFIQINITPKYATSKILITGIAGVEVSGGNYPTVHCRLYRDSTHIKSYLYWGYEGAVTTHRILNEPIHFLDSPTTTSALTYYAKLANSSGSAYTGTYAGKAHAYNPSTIVVQEIAQ